MITLPHYYPVSCHTDHVGPGSTFVAIKGTHYNGIDFVVQAIQKGATKIVVDEQENFSDDVQKLLDAKQITLVKVTNTRKALAQLSAQALGYPAKKLSIIAVTGTKGKSSTCFLLEHILQIAGYKTALLTSIHNKINTTIFSTHLTTQQPDYIHVFLDQAVKAGVTHVVMEVAAQALTLHRVEGIIFDYGVFTNFEPEHGEFYATTQDYFQAKYSILQHMQAHSKLLINNDSPACKPLFKHKQVYRYSLLEKTSDYYARYDIKNKNGTTIIVDTISYSSSKLYGLFNAYNMFAAIIIAQFLQISSSTIIKALDAFSGVPGRLEKYTLANGAQCFIDKAHTPGSFKALFETMRPLTNHLIIVFGAGGDRDALKRPIMGSLAAEYGDLIIVTSDNPRSEKVESIIEHIVNGIKPEYHNKLIIESDRYKALEHAYKNATKNSIILLLGKGPDEYELIQGIHYPFSERTIMLSFT